MTLTTIGRHCRVRHAPTADQFACRPCPAFQFRGGHA
jgi:hypothetical protein